MLGRISKVRNPSPDQGRRYRGSGRDSPLGQGSSQLGQLLCREGIEAVTTTAVRAGTRAGSCQIAQPKYNGTGDLSYLAPSAFLGATETVNHFEWSNIQRASWRS